MEVQYVEIYDVSDMEIQVFLAVHLFAYIIMHAFLALDKG